MDTWRGIFPAICTPFTVDDEPDLGAQRRLVRFVLDSGAHGIVTFGLAGEVLKLSSAERMALTDVILEETAGAVPVLVGAGGPSVASALELARYAERAGANAIVLPAPLAGNIGEAALADYFVRVASSVSIPVMIQDAPAYLGVGLGLDLVRRIAASAKNVRLVKLEVGPTEMSRWIETLGDEFSVWGGNGGIYLLDCIRTGASGIIPGSDLVDLLVAIYDADAAGDEARADALFASVLPMLMFQMHHSIDHCNACAKLVLQHRGVLDHVELRRPAAALGAVSRELLERHLAALGLAGVEARGPRRSNVSWDRKTG
jgi:4-hydroxy-tetrahydrodipicolinate synthase